MSDDIVERLRYRQHNTASHDVMEVCSLAADEIERLRTAEFVGRLPDYVKELEAEIERLRAEIEQLRSVQVRRLGND